MAFTLAPTGFTKHSFKRLIAADKSVSWSWQPGLRTGSRALQRAGPSTF